MASRKGASFIAVATQRIEELGDWRAKMLSHISALIKQTAPQVVEEWKWRKPRSSGTPVWSHNGMICTGETYKNIVKMTFALYST